jgi:uncharacterized protein YfiM (DUF2279 family)
MSNFYIPTGYDKVLHFAAGFVFALIAYGVNGQSYLSGIVVATAAGVSKELYDWLIKRRYFDWLDLIATVAGGAIGMLLMRFLAWLT